MSLKNLVFVLSVLCYVKCADVLVEGSSCWLNDTRNGTCVNLYRCTTAAYTNLFTNAGLAANVPPMPSTCTYREDGEPVVCCTDCELDDTENVKSLAVLPYAQLYKKTGSKAWTKCTEYFQTLPYPCRGVGFNSISKSWNDEHKCDELVRKGGGGGVGGRDAKEREFPHMALLGYGSDRETAQWLCGGSVISERFILTAAHCASTPSLGPIAYAGLGVLKRSDLNNFWKIYDIISIIKHPKYKAPSKYHDIALIKTATEINFGQTLLPACLDVEGKYTMGIGLAAGWGRIGHRGKLADHLQVMTLESYSNSVCSEMFPSHRLLKDGYDRKTQMCYGRQDEVVDTCEGDSGGPLNTYDPCLYFVFGITSYGKDCGIPGAAGMYTRVSYYVPWIESIVWPDE